ncbi:MAG: AtpZ/AtpI family protein [Robiginitomaculum sp.]
MKTPQDLDDLEGRIEAAQAKRPKPVEDNGQGSLLGMAWRLSTELVVAVMVGGALGYGVDYFAKTAPWFMVGGLFLGLATGVRNTFRLAERMDQVAKDAKQASDARQGE